MTWTPDDRVMADLRYWLIDQGFTVLSDHYEADLFGNQVVELARPIAVRLIRDRGQWRVEIAGPDGEWSSLDNWAARLTGPRSTSSSAIEQSDLLRRLLPDIELRAQSDGGSNRTG
jgi:hypothetical protein